MAARAALGNGFVPIPIEVFYDERLSDSAKLLYGYICLRSGEDGDYTRSQSDIASKLGWSARTVRRDVAQLRQAGYLSSEPTRVYAANTYRLHPCGSAKNGSTCTAKTGPLDDIPPADSGRCPEGKNGRSYKVLRTEPKNTPDTEVNTEVSGAVNNRDVRQGFADPPAALPGPPPGDAFEDFKNGFKGEFPGTTWRVFGQYVNTPEKIETLLRNLPLWMATPKYVNGYGRDAIKFLSSEIWMNPPPPSRAEVKAKAAAEEAERKREQDERNERAWREERIRDKTTAAAEMYAWRDLRRAGVSRKTPEGEAMFKAAVEKYFPEQYEIIRQEEVH